MPIVDTYRRNVEQKSREIAQLLDKKSAEIYKIATISSKIISANQSMARSSSSSIIKSKMSEIDRYQKERNDCEKRISDIEKKLAQKQRELGEEQKKVMKEELQLQKKQAEERQKQQRESQRQMEDFSRTLIKHDYLHKSTQSKIAELEKLPDRIIVLFLAANPVDQSQLRLDEEARAINETITKSKLRDSVKLETRWAVRPFDILQAINELEPTIIHFSGHGSDKDEIVFQRDDGSTHLITKEAIVQTITTSSKVKLVFFNTCFSKNQANLLTQHIDAAIGMNTSIGDEAARIFSSQFYSSIGFGLSLQQAFDQAKAALMLENIPEHQTPELFISERLDADQIFLVSK